MAVQKHKPNSESVSVLSGIKNGSQIEARQTLRLRKSPKGATEKLLGIQPTRNEEKAVRLHQTSVKKAEFQKDVLNWRDLPWRNTPEFSKHKSDLKAALKFVREPTILTSGVKKIKRSSVDEQP